MARGCQYTLLDVFYFIRVAVTLVIKLGYQLHNIEKITACSATIAHVVYSYFQINPTVNTRLINQKRGIFKTIFFFILNRLHNITIGFTNDKTRKPACQSSRRLSFVV